MWTVFIGTKYSIVKFWLKAKIWPIKSVMRLIIASLIGQFQSRVKFYAGIFLKDRVEVSADQRQRQLWGPSFQWNLTKGLHRKHVSNSARGRLAVNSKWRGFKVQMAIFDDTWIWGRRERNVSFLVRFWPPPPSFSLSLSLSHTLTLTHTH